MAVMATPLAPEVAAQLHTLIVEHHQALTPAPWSPHTFEQRVEAAILMAQDALSDVQICRTTGISDRATLRMWRHEPAYGALLGALRQVLLEATLQTGVANALTRLRAKDTRWRRLNAVIEQRAQHYHREPTDPDYAAMVPGGDTGLLVQGVKILEDGTPVYEYRVDTQTLRELRELEADVAKELGQMAPERSLHLHGSVSLQDALDPEALAMLRAMVTGRDRLAALTPPVVEQVENES